jgi:C4-dicarboxylate-specific signal transduction histidine kinase
MITQNLQKRLIKLQLGLTTIVLTVSWVLISLNDYYIFKNQSVKNFETVARILSHNLSTCLAFKNKDECQRVLSIIQQEKDVLKAVVTDSGNETITEYKRAVSGNTEHQFDYSRKDFEFEIQDNFIRSTYPIFVDGVYEGRLFIVADFDMFEIFGKRHAITFLVIIIVSFLMALFLSGYMQRKISQQINLILETMQKISRSKTYNLRIHQHPDLNLIDVAEFRQLADSFDDMISQVETRDIHLHQQNRNLEKMVEEKVQEVLRTAELASLGEMAGGVAHEINNPLTIIKSSTRILQKLLSQDKIDLATFKEFLGTIDVTVDRIAKIVAGLRNISRHSGREEKTECSYVDIFNDVLDVAESKFKSRGIEVYKKFTSDEANKKFMANRVQLSQVLLNLLNNSYDAIANTNGPWINLEVKIYNDHIQLIVTDSGTGIPLKVREKMFNPFFTTKEIGKGTGIGLAISKSMVEKMNGKFFYNEKSSNSSFIVQLPL